MSVDAIKEITQAERLAREKKDASTAEQKKMLASAQAEGQKKVERARLQAAEEQKQRLVETERLARDYSEKLRAETEQQSSQLRQAAEAQKQKAVDFIVERIVNS